MEAVEQVEVIRGPGSALYGANAFLGVVNVVTRKPDQTMASASGMGGLVRDRGMRGAQAFANVVSGEGKHAARMTVAASAWHIDRSGLAEPGSSPLIAQYRGQTSRNDIAQPLSLLSTGQWGIGDFGTLQYLVSHQRSDYGAEFAEDTPLTHDSRVAMSNTIARVTHRIETPLLSGNLRVQTYGAMTIGQSLPAERLDVGNANSYVQRLRHSRAFDVGTEAAFTRGPHMGLIGVQYLDVADQGDTFYDVNLDANGNVGDKDLRVLGHPFRYGNLGTYAQAVVYPIEKLGLTGNVRFDHNEAWKDRASVLAAASYEVVSHLNAKAIYGTSYVPPAPTQLYAQPISNPGVQGNPLLTPGSTLKTLEAAFSVHVA